MSFQEIEYYLSLAQRFLLDNPLLVAAAGLAAWLLTSLALVMIRHRDTKIPFLAEFFDVDVDRIVALPPATALWTDYHRMNSEAVSDVHFPQGAATLQGSYLIHAEGGMTLVAVHNFENHNIYRDPEEPDLADFIEPSIGQHHRLEAHRIPVEIEEDTARRANIVEFLLKAKFGYPGKVRAINLLRDKDDIAPDPDLISLRSGEELHRFTFDHQDAARRALYFDENPVEAKIWPKISRWVSTYPGRQASRFKILLRFGLLFLTVGILASGHSTLTPNLLSAAIDALTG